MGVVNRLQGLKTSVFLPLPLSFTLCRFSSSQGGPFWGRASQAWVEQSSCRQLMTWLGPKWPQGEHEVQRSRGRVGQTTLTGEERKKQLSVLCRGQGRVPQAEGTAAVEACLVGPQGH